MGLLDGLRKSDEELKDEALTKCNIFEGVEFKVLFPDTELKIATASGLKKGAATLIFGIVGLAATSGIKQESKNRIVSTIVQVVPNGIVFKKATKDNKDLRIPYDNIIEAKRDDEVKYKLIITLLENQDIKLILYSKLTTKQEEFVEDQFINVINERACGAQYEEAGWGLEHATAEPQETKQESGSLMDELERLGNMYKEGLLTDDEFAAMKKKLIEE